jgi:hypothetical protein
VWGGQAASAAASSSSASSSRPPIGADPAEVQQQPGFTASVFQFPDQVKTLLDQSAGGIEPAGVSGQHGQMPYRHRLAMARAEQQRQPPRLLKGGGGLGWLAFCSTPAWSTPSRSTPAARTATVASERAATERMAAAGQVK